MIEILMLLLVYRTVTGRAPGRVFWLCVGAPLAVVALLLLVLTCCG
jgi:hypothetical protein